MHKTTKDINEPAAKSLVLNKYIIGFWSVCLMGAAAGLFYLTLYNDTSFSTRISNPLIISILLFAMAFIAEYADSSLGMGYGTTLTPVLLLFGFSPLQIVPAILFSEFLSGILAGGLHHRMGNVDLNIKTQAGKIMLITVGCSIVGTVAAVYMALTLPKQIVKLYIGVMILGIGLFILAGNRLISRFSWKKIIGLGSIAAFNKGLSGGGYGPLVTGGQVLIGIPGKNAVGVTSFAEGLVCLVGLILYIIFHGWMDWRLALPLSAGAIVSVPMATWTVRILPEAFLKKSIGIATIFLGALTLINLYL
jgi:hypothetical protein